MTDDILIERRGALGLVTLNRPKALNALTLPMIEALSPALDRWATDPAVRAVAIVGAGDRAFCAGGDVRAAWEAGMAHRAGRGDGSLTAAFFREEYRLNRKIARFPKPYVAILDGIVMGGGVGLSVHGSHRVVTPRTLFAMPETGIGLFPDVGATYVLSRMPGLSGTHLALTGARIGMADCLLLGAATHAVADAAGLVDALAGALAGAVGGVGDGAGDGADDARAAVDAVLAGAATDPGPAPLAARRATVDACFAGGRVEAIVAALDAAGDPWATAQREALAHLSPTSLQVTLAAIRRAATLDLDGCLVMEYRLSQACMARHDFYEGIRALLVDKDRSPKWSPATLDGVDDALVDAHFAAPAGGDLTFPA
jgi:enoyl-CoA hydratase